MNIQYMTHSGDDLLVVNAARTSFDKQSTELSEGDKKLINFLAREKHVLPFRHPQVTLRVYAPLFVIRQLDKHQVGFSTSEVSRRYVTTGLEFYEPESFRMRPENMKQGSVELEEEPPFWDQDNRTVLRDAYHAAESHYSILTSNGVAPEQARMVLPQSMYTTQVKTGSLLGWHHLVQLRTAPDAQKEVQIIARLIEETVGNLYPVSWEALSKYS